MKITKCAYAALILLVIAVFTNSFFIHKITDDLARDAAAIETEDIARAGEEFSLLLEKFKRAEKFINLTVSHDDLTNIEESFSEIIGAAEAMYAPGVKIAKSRLVDSLEHLGRLSGINPDSIL